MRSQPRIAVIRAQERHYPEIRNFLKSNWHRLYPSKDFEPGPDNYIPPSIPPEPIDMVCLYENGTIRIGAICYYNPQTPNFWYAHIILGQDSVRHAAQMFDFWRSSIFNDYPYLQVLTIYGHGNEKIYKWLAKQPQGQLFMIPYSSTDPRTREITAYWEYILLRPENDDILKNKHLPRENVRDDYGQRQEAKTTESPTGRTDQADESGLDSNGVWWRKLYRRWLQFFCPRRRS